MVTVEVVEVLTTLELTNKILKVVTLVKMVDNIQVTDTLR
jgi:hypothetical protein